MTERKLTKEEIEEIIENNENLKILKECIEESWKELIKEYMADIMSCGSISYGEAMVLTRQFFIRGIKPKSDEFYKVMSNVKTMWEQ